MKDACVCTLLGRNFALGRVHPVRDLQAHLGLLIRP